MPPAVLAIGGRNSPFAVALMLLCVLVGGLGATGNGDKLLWYSAFDLRLWYIGLLGGGLASLAGMGWRDPITGMLIERVGQFVLAVLMLAFAAGLLLLGGMSALSSATGDFVFGTACIARVVQIHVAARKIRRAVKIIDEASQ